jgi:stage IV sporulation protein FB
VAGVTIRLHLTFVALLVLVALSADEMGQSAVDAVGWMLVLFTCVVVHELAHSIVAHSKGIDVHEIDLLPIGGVSRLERLPDDWRDESAIAVAGPLASLGIALAAFMTAAVAGHALLPPTLWSGNLLVRLGWANLVLAGFNLLPVFPMDGGRVLRAQLERRRTRVEATRQAVVLSRIAAAAMIGLGVAYNVWLVAIGLFVVLAASVEEAAVLIHAALGPSTARDLAAPCPLTLWEGLAAADARHVASLQPQVGYPVVGAGGRTIGVVELAELGAVPPGTPIRRLARGGTAEATEPLEEVAARLREGPVLVVDRGATVGVITSGLLDQHLQERLAELGT